MKASTSLSSALVAFAAVASAASPTTSEPPESTIEPTGTAISAVAATQTASSPVSNVKGAAFQRFYQIWLENTDTSAAAGNPDLKFLASQGITLTNYNAVTHPSEPNYCAAVGGDHFGMENDNFHSLPANISTIVDLLDTKGISWGEYMDGLPYAGFQGFNYTNQLTNANNYVRKHNPLMLYSSISNNDTRRAQIKPLTSFATDLTAKTLPQWAFITPNMTNDGHDTNITFASSWERSFVEPLLNNTEFMKGTLMLLTFDETETYTQHNKIFSILIGGSDVIPENLKGTSDNTFYNHYSGLSSMSVNFGLPSLGRWDCEANVFAVVANKTGYKNAEVNTTNLYFNSSYPGPLSSSKYSPLWPVPNTNAKCASGMGVLESVKNTWGKETATYNYTNVYPYDAVSANNIGDGTPTSGGALNTTSNSTSANGTSTNSSSSSTPSQKSGASSSFIGMSFGTIFAAAGLVAILL